MANLPAISIDSFGNRGAAALGLPPLTNSPGSDTDRRHMAQFFEVLRRDPPGQWTEDAWAMANAFTNAVYIAVNTMMAAVGGSELVVLERRAGRVSKSASSSAGSGESEWSPVAEDHPLAALFADPNPNDTTGDFLEEYVMCLCLFGQAAIYWQEGRDGKPAAMWNLRKNFMSATTAITADYPRGAWYYTMPRPMFNYAGAGRLTIPRERVVLHRRPHPRFPWDGYSPLTGGNKLVDYLNGVIDSRQMAMDRGLSLDAVVSVKGGSVEQIRQVQAQFMERFAGSNRGQRIGFLDGDQTDVSLLGNTPDKMSYKDSYRDGVAAVLALFGVPAVCAFLADADYSGFYAAARAWRDGGLNSTANGIAARLNKDFVRPHWGDRYKVQVKLPPLMDPDQRERQWSLLNGMTSAVTFTVNEARAAFDMKPKADGDVTPAELSAKIQKASQPEQPEGGGGMPGMGGDDPNADPLAALLGGGGDPNAEPDAPGDVDSPDVGAASAGSLPGTVSKSVRVRDYFARLVAEVTA